MHGKEHGFAAHHPLVVKQGTIKPDGTASIYCYECDDDVKDDNLADHLAKLGIDIARQQKTEKSITEMNLDLNLSFTLSKVLEDGKVLPPVFGPGNTGMVNLGNTCYMNSAVQVIMSMPEFKNSYLGRAEAHLENCDKYAPDCFMCQICKLAVGLNSGEYS